MTIEDVKLKIEELGTRVGGFSSSDKNEIEFLFYEVLNKTFVKSGCSDCYRDAFFEIRSHIQKNKKMKEKSNYALKNGVLLQIFGTGKNYTNLTLTDEVAEAFLKENPKAINQFARYPEDWEDRTKGGKDEPIVLDETLVNELAEKLKAKVTKTTLREEYKGFVIDGKQITGALLNEHIKAADELNKQ